MKSVFEEISKQALSLSKKIEEQHNIFKLREQWYCEEIVDIELFFKELENKKSNKKPET